jgi:hypothetical protein
MELYYIFWVEVALIFIGLAFFLSRALTDDLDQRVAEAERRGSELRSREVGP